MHSAVSTANVKPSDFSGGPKKNQVCLVFFSVIYTAKQIRPIVVSLSSIYFSNYAETVISSGQDPFLSITCSKAQVSKSKAPWKHAAAVMFISAVW